MIWLAAAALAATGLSWLALTTLALALRSVIRQAARERDLLINQLLHAQGKTWQPPPANGQPDQPVTVETHRYAVSPEQYPDDI